MMWLSGGLAGCLLAWSSALLAADAPDPAAPFVDGDVVAFIGDSITHDGRWVRFIADFYATRFPQRHVTFLNKGIAGDTTAGVLRRLDRDILSDHPTVAVIMLGMNDVGRTAYVEHPDAAHIAQQTAAQQHYRENFAALLARLRAGGVQRLIAVTPSPYEDTARLAAPNLPGVNGGLTACAVTVGALATSAGAAVVDLHTPMTHIDHERQQTDPTFTLVGPDRVHPGSAGHLLMAYLFLTTQRVPAVVSRVVIDTHAQMVTATAAAVSECRWDPAGPACTVLAEALPFPLNPDASAAREWAPIEHDLDREELQVDGLAVGTYRLEVDHARLGTWTAAQLAAGINLAFVAGNPTYRQSQAVLALSEQRRQAQGDLRTVALVEWNWLTPAKVPVDDPTQAAAGVAAYVVKNPTPFNHRLADTYATAKPGMAAIQTRIAELTTRMQAAAAPRPHRYQLIRE